MPSSENRVWQVRTFDDVQAEYSSRFPEGGTLSFNQKIDIWYGEHAETLSREALLVQAEKWYSSSKARMESALERLLKKQNDFSQAEQLRHQGDLILSNIHLIAPKAKFLECDDYETGRTVRILLNPEKTANENAAAYYENYKKAVPDTVF